MSVDDFRFRTIAGPVQEIILPASVSGQWIQVDGQRRLAIRFGSIGKALELADAISKRYESSEGEGERA